MSRSKAQLEAENKMLRSARTAEGWVQLGQTAIKWGAIVGIAYFASSAVEALAGRTTLANIGVNFLANVEVSIFLAWFVGLGGLFFGFHQNKLRKDTVERLQGRIRSLESKIDPNRSSSNLTERGETRPEDRL